MNEQIGFANDVILHGKVLFKSVKDLGNGKKMFKAKINGIKVIAWDNIADNMDKQVSNGDMVKVHGVINERSYKTNCKNCKSEYTSYWTDVEVYKFEKTENK